VARILVSGASGLIGSTLVSSLAARGDAVVRLVRRVPEAPNQIQWDPTREIPPETVSGFDVAIHLSGESIAPPWTARQKHRIRDSRVVSTETLTRALTMAAVPPGTFLCASAIGYYGDRGDQILTEESPSGEGFLPVLCREWERATEPATRAGIGVVRLRFGMVLSRRGGALKQMSLPFRLGLGGRIGNGRQWCSWIHIDDAVRAILYLIDRPEFRFAMDRRPAPPSQPQPGISERSAPVNVVSPNPVSNAELAGLLARVLRRPGRLALPAFAAKLAFGDFAEEVLLASTRVLPKHLIEGGFEFQYPKLSQALAQLYDSPRRFQ
jgi:uncharacterized protein